VAVDVLWLWRPGGTVSHAFRAIHVAGARTALCGQSGRTWVESHGDRHCGHCEKRLRDMETSSKGS
jgi:hypothetical protein